MSDITELLERWSEGDAGAFTELVPIVYHELRKLARYQLSHERPGVTMQPTVLVHEAYLRLVDQNRTQWNGRAHFFGAASQVMRRVLVDRARERQAQKRGDGIVSEPLSVANEVASEPAWDVLALDDALNDLAAIDPHRVKIVELRYFGGLSVRETAEVMGVSEPTIKRDWALARAWLYRRLSGGSATARPPVQPPER
jgi:RNA polymerase sigma factor (TIGR02999 family)